MKLSRLPLASVTRRSRARIGALAAVVAIAAAVSTVVASPGVGRVGRLPHTPERGDGALHRLPGVGRGGVRKTD
jgi:hypothetical protein